MIDINVYRQRIGNFKQPDQKNINREYLQKHFTSMRLCRGALHITLIILTLFSFSSFNTAARVEENCSPWPKQSCFRIVSTNILRRLRSEHFIPVQVVDYNFIARYTNGNRTNRGIKLCHWNAGNSHLRNKMESIENVVKKYSPHVIGISEANLLKNHDINEVQIAEYELITSTTMENISLQYSRVVVYKHSSIISKVRKDLMSPDFSSIWLECGLPNKRKFLVCNLYREWQYLGQGNDNASKDIQQQLSRWIIFIDQFEQTLPRVRYGGLLSW